MRFLFYTTYIFCSIIYLTKAQEITIDKHSWMSKNLETTTFRNGDIIQEARNKQEMLDAFVDQKPVWCYYDFNPKNGEKYGKLYNWYAVNDSRGLAPSGYRIPSESEFRKLQYYLNQNEEDLKGYQNRMIYDSILNNIYEYAGGITKVEKFKEKRFFVNLGKNACWWSATECKNLLSNDNYDAWGITFSKKNQSILNCYFKGEGLSVRCIKVNNDTSIKDTSDIVITKDGIVLGRKHQVTKIFSRLFKDNFNEYKKKGLIIDTNKIYECMWKKFKTISYSDFNNKDTIGSIIKECIYMGFNFIDILSKSILVKYCKDSLVNMKDVRSLQLPNKESVETFCDCFANNLLSVEKSKRSSIDFASLNGEGMNDIIFPCLQKAQSVIEKNNFSISSIYNRDHIIGSSDSSIVPCLQIGGKRMVQVTIGDVSKYYLFDSGSEFLIIDDELESTFIKKNILDPNMFTGEKDVQLADKSKVKVKVYKVSEVIFGDYKISNVEIGVLDNGYLLCGLSLLNKFKKWEFDSDSNTLKLFK